MNEPVKIPSELYCAMPWLKCKPKVISTEQMAEAPRNLHSSPHIPEFRLEKRSLEALVDPLRS